MGTTKTSTIVIQPKKVWRMQGSQDNQVNAEIAKMERKGWTYVGTLMDRGRLRLNFEKTS